MQEFAEGFAESTFKFASLIVRRMGNPRLTNIKTQICVLINFTYESVKYLYFLSSGAARVFCFFVNNNLFDERVKHFGSQLCGLGVLLD